MRAGVEPMERPRRTPRLRAGDRREARKDQERRDRARVVARLVKRGEAFSV
jgi:hypothetical protein